MKIFQVKMQRSNDERFCFHAKDEADAQKKLARWLRRHGYTRGMFTATVVDKPFYTDNIRNDWVSELGLMT